MFESHSETISVRKALFSFKDRKKVSKFVENF